MPGSRRGLQAHRAYRRWRSRREAAARWGCTVLIGHTAGGGSRTVLDSRGQIPAGDLYAVTLISPGTYRATNLASQKRLQITVAVPPRDEPYNPARPVLVRVGDDGFDPAAAHILAGQSIVLLAGTPARFLVEPAPPPDAP